MDEKEIKRRLRLANEMHDGAKREYEEYRALCAEYPEGRDPEVERAFEKSQSYWARELERLREKAEGGEELNMHEVAKCVWRGCENILVDKQRFRVPEGWGYIIFGRSVEKPSYYGGVLHLCPAHYTEVYRILNEVADATATLGPKTS